MENFKIEELEPRLEMGRRSAGPETTKAVGEDGYYYDCLYCDLYS